MSKKEILHIAPDQKFINAANYLYEKAFPGKNTFFIIKASEDSRLTYVDPKEHFKIYNRSQDLETILLDAIKKYRVVVFHGLNREMVKVFNRTRDKRKFIWTFWGAEVYNSDHLYDTKIYSSKTRLLLLLSSWFNKFLPSHRNYAVSTLRRIPYDKFDTVISGILHINDKYEKAKRSINHHKISQNGSLEKEKAISDFHFVATINDDLNHFKEIDLVRDDCQTIPFTYYPLEFLFEEMENQVEGNNILLGNSATNTNNHVDIIDVLAELNLDKKNVITPLNYGSEEYAALINEYGSKKLGTSFYPLTDFLPLDEYHDLIQKCRFVIMNHYRSQGVGNILATLYLGAKVFLNDTPIYKYLKEIGCHVFSIEKNFLREKEKAFVRLTPQEVEHNRAVLKEKFSTETVVQKMQDSFRESFHLELE